MRIILTAATAAVLATVLTGTLAFADEPSCPNQCPLAQGANALRTNGAEGVQKSEIVCHEMRREVLDALDRV